MLHAATALAMISLGLDAMAVGLAIAVWRTRKYSRALLYMFAGLGILACQVLVQHHADILPLLAAKLILLGLGLLAIVVLAIFVRQKLRDRRRREGVDNGRG